MSTPTAKRQRADTQGAIVAPPSQHELETALDALDPDSIRRILLGAAQANPRLAAIVCDRYDELIEKEKARVINFDHYSKSVWREINITHSRKSGSQQYDASSGVSSYIHEVIEHITSQAGATSSFGTKKSALETLRKIGKTLCLAGGDTLPHEVSKDFQFSTTMADAMSSVLHGMTAEERKRMCEEGEGGKFVGKLEELIELAEDMCMEGLEEVLELLEQGDEEGDEEGEEHSGDNVNTDDQHAVLAYPDLPRPTVP